MADISIDQLADAIVSAVQNYTEAVTEAISKEVDNTANLVLKEVKASAPKKTGDYAKGFKKINKSLPGNRRYVIWNPKYYSLVHLLEKGHAKRGGGRVQAYPHMEPAMRTYGDTMPDRIKEIIQRGG